MVDTIWIQGNKKTKNHIILRELTFNVGDTLYLDHLMKEMEASRKNVNNLQLFNFVQINVKNWEGNSVGIQISVVERWYHIPVPILELADRNFNEWWVENNHNLRRLNYGLDYFNPNFRGRKDVFEAGFRLGFQQGLWGFYELPALNQKQTLGFRSFFKLERMRQVPIKTDSNKLVYLEGDRFVNWKMNEGVLLSYRNKIFDTHYFELQHHHSRITDTVAQENPDFLLNGKKKLNFFQINYRFDSDHRDYKAYPLKGYQWSFEFQKIGLGIFRDVNYFNLIASVSGFLPLGKKFFISSQLKGKVSASSKQPYSVQKGLGYEQNFVRGYEFYVIDGQHYAFFKSNLKRQLFSIVSKGSKFLKRESLSKSSFAMYIKMHFDMGYVHDEVFDFSSELNNSLLLGGGVGIDFALLYDIVLRVEYSFSTFDVQGKRLPQNGVYLHFVLDIRDVLDNPVLQ